MNLDDTLRSVGESLSKLLPGRPTLTPDQVKLIVMELMDGA